MADLINRDALLAEYDRVHIGEPGKARKLIAGAKAVDAVPVVRCRDCKQFEPTCPGYGYCYHWDYEPGMSPNEVEDDDFCSYGKRRLGNG